MANIDIRKFVDINIKHHTTSSGTSTRDTTVLFLNISTYPDFDEGIFSSYEECLDIVDGEDEENYCRVYFANGGRKLYMRSVANDAASVLAALKELPDEYIVVSFMGYESTLSQALQQYDAEQDASDKLVNYGIKTKFGVFETTDTSTSALPHHLTKYTSALGTSATIAAYLSRIDISKVDSIRDYDFTVEDVYAEEADNDVLTACMQANLNVDMMLAGRIRNIGGNTLDGLDLVNEYALVLLQQTVSEKVLSVLTSKLRGEIGVAAIHTAIAQELQRYVKCGYLTTDKIYSDEDMTVEYNGKTYTIIAQDTPLLLGYQVKVLPYSSLSEEDKRKHAAPPIYIVLADSYSIRYVKISGEVF